MPEQTQHVGIVRPREAAFLPDMPTISAEVIEKALTIGDLSKMPPDVRVRYYLAVCQSAGLNPLTRPFTPMKNQAGEMILYANKDCAEQLRAKHRISVRTVERLREGDLYLITVEARLPDGRSEEAQAITDLAGLKGQTLANAMMKTETKAKRRVTLALVGLGFPLADDADVLRYDLFSQFACACGATDACVSWARTTGRHLTYAELRARRKAERTAGAQEGA